MLRGETGEREYKVREFRASDVEAFLDLHVRVFDDGYGREWFAWKYEENPYVDHVPILVVEAGGELVGARPFFALEMSVGGDRRLALQPGDTMVHPDHRREGLFKRMTETAIERYSDGEPDFFFNFPNRISGPGYLKLGWETVAEQPSYYRVQHPKAVGVRRTAGTGARVASALLKPLLDGYNRLSNARLGSVDGPTVETYESVPASILDAIESEQSQRGIHVHRDEQFYEWRFDNPAWDYVTYVARRAGEPVSAMVVGRSVDTDEATAKVTDVVPVPDEEDSGEVDALLRQVVRDHGHADVVVAPATLPSSTMRRAGFHRDDRPPLSFGSNPTTHVVRSLTGDWEPNGVDLTNAENWRLTFAEHDTS